MDCSVVVDLLGGTDPMVPFIIVSAIVTYFLLLVAWRNS
jgi:hypothetical protein